MNRYRDRGLKLTPQRIAIFDYLEGNKDHPSAEDIYRSIKKKFPTMSFATVYNTLASLKKTGAIRELTIDPGKKRFDPDMKFHNHLVCVTCRRVVDIEENFKFELPAGMGNDFTLLESRVEFFGLCPECRKKR